MDTFGLFKVSVLVSDPEYRVRRVALFRARCERAECGDLYTQFLARNPHLGKGDLVAIFVPDTLVIRV